MDTVLAERTLASILKSPLRSVDADLSVHDALRLSERSGSHHLTLFQGQRLLGVVCTCDLEEVALDAPVSRALRRPPVTLDAADSLDDAARRMSEEQVGSVLILRGGEAVGLVTREEVMAAGGPTLEGFRCDVCGATARLQRHGAALILCSDCRANAEPASLDEDELGGSG
jgi:CBS domain-containing protein